MKAFKKITNAYTKTFDRDMVYVIIEIDGKEQILKTFKGDNKHRTAMQLVADIKAGQNRMVSGSSYPMRSA